MKTTLLVMAAGIGSRFGGGIKQLEPVGLNDEIIMDYSVHDAIAAGFNKLIFVIRKDIEADFRQRIGNRIEALCQKIQVEVHYVFQDLRDLPAGCTVPEGRTKPWGTGQAVLAARELIREPFAVINADDYYGKNAYQELHDWLMLQHNENAIAMAGFILGEIPWFLRVLEEQFAVFFREDVPGNPAKAEYLLPTLIGGMLRREQCTVKVLPTTDKWFGVTYKEDKESVVNSFRALIDAGVYGRDLYADLK